MTRITVSSVVVAVVAGAAFLVPAQGSTGRLTGEVGPGFKIEVTKGEKDLKTLKAGTYKIHVEDKATIHNFHLIGPGVNKKTGVKFKGGASWTLAFKAGKYTYRSDATKKLKRTFSVR